MPVDSEQRRKTKSRLRTFLRDRPEFNRLTGQVEFTDDDLDWALNMAVDDWNFTPPPLTAVGVDDHPAPGLLVLGAALYACDSDAIREARNPFQFADGGTAAEFAQKVQLYRAALEPVRAKYEDFKQSAKVTANLGLAWGGFHSEYFYIPRF